MDVTFPCLLTGAVQEGVLLGIKWAVQGGMGSDVSVQWWS